MVIVVPNSTSPSYFKSDSFCAVSFVTSEIKLASEVQMASVAIVSWLGKLVLWMTGRRSQGRNAASRITRPCLNLRRRKRIRCLPSRKRRSEKTKRRRRSETDNENARQQSHNVHTGARENFSTTLLLVLSKLQERSWRWT
jgi:hypothetical protein